jgi:hypothetical protein
MYPPSILGKAVEGRDARMIQLREELRLALEASDALRILSQIFGEDLDRDLAPKLRVTGSIDFALSAGSESAHDFVGAQPGSGFERHDGKT